MSIGPRHYRARGETTRGTDMHLDAPLYLYYEEITEIRRSSARERVGNIIREVIIKREENILVKEILSESNTARGNPRKATEMRRPALDACREFISLLHRRDLRDLIR